MPIRFRQGSLDLMVSARRSKLQNLMIQPPFVGLCEKMKTMKRAFAATVWREEDLYVSQCLEVDVASQGESEEEALANLREALELHFEPPRPTRPPKVRMIEVEVGAA